MNILDEDFMSENNFFSESSTKETDKGISLSIRESQSKISFKDSFLLATILHPLVLLIIWLLCTMFALFGIKLPFITKQEPPKKDIEFILTNQNKIIIPHKLITYKSNKEGAKNNVINKTKSKIDDNASKKTPDKSNNKPITRTVIQMSKKPHKGNNLPQAKVPDVFSIPMPKNQSFIFKITSDLKVAFEFLN